MTTDHSHEMGHGAAGQHGAMAGHEPAMEHAPVGQSGIGLHRPLLGNNLSAGGEVTDSGMGIAVARVLHAEPRLKVGSGGPFREEPGAGSGVDP
jgi:hypothetical protein